MSGLRLRLLRPWGWLLAYLWSVPLVAFLSDLANWQYDDPLMLWWVAAAYTLPLLAFAELFGRDLAVATYLLALGIATAMVLRFGRVRSA